MESFGSFDIVFGDGGYGLSRFEGVRGAINMKILIGIGIYILIAILNIFLMLLYSRLFDNESPEELYNSNSMEMILGMAAFSFITFPIVIIFFIGQIGKKFMIALVELAVALHNENKKSEE